MSGLPNSKKKYRVKLKQNDNDENHAISAHYLRISGNCVIHIVQFMCFQLGQSVIVVMDNEGNISIYSLPELQLLHKENCVDAADAM